MFLILERLLRFMLGSKVEITVKANKQILIFRLIRWIYVTTERQVNSLGYYVMVMPSPAVCMDKPNLIHSQFCCCACSLYTLLDSAMRYGGGDVRWLTVPPASSVYYSRVRTAQCALPTGAELCSCRKQLWQWAVDQPKNMKCIRSQWWSKPLESHIHSIILEEIGGNTRGFFFLSFHSTLMWVIFLYPPSFFIK